MKDTFIFKGVWALLLGFLSAEFLSTGLFLPVELRAAMSSSNYQIWADVISDGGLDESNSANYGLKDTVGESAIGRASSTNYSGRAGFREMEKDQSLTLTLGSTSVDLGELSKTAAKTGSHTLIVETNSATGVSVTFTGSTLTCSACSGTNTVTAIGATAAASAVGTGQFGFNAIYSSGTAPTAAAKSPYHTSGSYAFHSGDEIISSAAAINATTFNLNYLANIAGTETAGTYITTLSFTATANF